MKYTMEEYRKYRTMKEEVLAAAQKHFSTLIDNYWINVFIEGDVVIGNTYDPHSPDFNPNDPNLNISHPDSLFISIEECWKLI